MRELSPRCASASSPWLSLGDHNFMSPFPPADSHLVVGLLAWVVCGGVGACVVPHYSTPVHARMSWQGCASRSQPAQGWAAL